MDMGIQRQVLVRSSSRLGYLDFGVNAKRINYIAAQVTALMCTKLNARKLNSTTLQQEWRLVVMRFLFLFFVVRS